MPVKESIFVTLAQISEITGLTTRRLIRALKMCNLEPVMFERQFTSSGGKPVKDRWARRAIVENISAIQEAADFRCERVSQPRVPKG